MALLLADDRLAGVRIGIAKGSFCIELRGAAHVAADLTEVEKVLLLLAGGARLGATSTAGKASEGNA